MLQEVRQLNRFCLISGHLAEDHNMDYLGVPVRDMFITLPISFLTQRGNNISKCAQTLVDVLCLFQPILIIPCPALLKSFRTSEINEVE